MGSEVRQVIYQRPLAQELPGAADLSMAAGDNPDSASSLNVAATGAELDMARCESRPWPGKDRPVLSVLRPGQAAAMWGGDSLAAPHLSGRSVLRQEPYGPEPMRVMAGFSQGLTMTPGESELGTQARRQSTLPSPDPLKENQCKR